MKLIAGVCALVVKSAYAKQPDQHGEALRIAREIVKHAEQCFNSGGGQDESGYQACVTSFCEGQCGHGKTDCEGLCERQAVALFQKLVARSSEARHEVTAMLQVQEREAAGEQADAMSELQTAESRMFKLNQKISDRAAQELRSGDSAKGQRDMAKAKELAKLQDQVKEHLSKVQVLNGQAEARGEVRSPTSFLQMKKKQSPEDALAKEMTHDLEMNFNKIAPFGKEDTAKELQDHAAKTQDTLVDAVENAEVAEIKRAVFRALTRLRAATIKEFDTIARLETQAIDAYNDAHHYRAENPLAHLHEDEAPVETDKLKSFH